MLVYRAAVDAAGLMALFSGVFHAGWNVIAKRSLEPRGAALAILTADFVIMGFVTPFVPHAITWSAVPWIALAAIGEAGYVVSLGIALSKGDLGVTYGVSRSVALLAVWPLGYFIFHDVPSSAAWVATGFLCVGMLLCQPRSSDTKKSLMSWPWTIATGLFVGVYHTAYKGSVHAGADAITTFTGSIAIAVPLLWLIAPREVQRSATNVVRTQWRTTLLAGVMSTASFVLAVLALSMTQSGRVLGLRNGSIGYAALFALWLGERPSQRQWLGLATLFAGVIVLVIAA